MPVYSSWITCQLVGPRITSTIRESSGCLEVAFRSLRMRVDNYRISKEMLSTADVYVSLSNSIGSTLWGSMKTRAHKWFTTVGVNTFGWPEYWKKLQRETLYTKTFIMRGNEPIWKPYLSFCWFRMGYEAPQYIEKIYDLLKKHGKLSDRLDVWALAATQALHCNDHHTDLRYDHHIMPAGDYSDMCNYSGPDRPRNLLAALSLNKMLLEEDCRKLTAITVTGSLRSFSGHVNFRLFDNIMKNILPDASKIVYDARAVFYKKVTQFFNLSFDQIEKKLKGKSLRVTGKPT